MIVTYINKLTGEYQIIFDAVSLDNAIERFWTDSETDKELLFLKRNRIIRCDKRIVTQSKYPKYRIFDSCLIVQLYCNRFSNTLHTKYNPFKEK